MKIIRLISSFLKTKFLTTFLLTLFTFLSASILLQSNSAKAADPCTNPTKPIVIENCKAGNPSTEWDIQGKGDDNLQGFTTDISYNKGETAKFKIKTDASSYRLDIYRMGYYGGNGARIVATVNPSVSLPQNQPTCLNGNTEGFVDCGNWAESASWAIPSNAVSGIYFAKLVRLPADGRANFIVFIVRDDTSHSDLLFQTSDATWQAYNEWGGGSTYHGQTSYIQGRAPKVSYNRPFRTDEIIGDINSLFAHEYPMVKWLEKNGYDVNYFTDVDTDRRGNLLTNHKAFLSVGHDEYWSTGQRNNVEAARDAGVNLAFFSGNEVYGKNRWEPSIDGTSTPYRTFVNYKEFYGDLPDPSHEWTGFWYQKDTSDPLSDGGKPENSLTGNAYGNIVHSDPLVVPSQFSKLRFWKNTNVASLTTGQSASFPKILGYEWNEDVDNGVRPPGLIKMSNYTFYFYPDKYPADRTHNLTLYRHQSGALVFGSATISWSWGLDTPLRNPGQAVPDQNLKQATVNLFADMGAQPASIESGLVPTSKSTDTQGPTVTMNQPDKPVRAGATFTLTGSTSDALTGSGAVGGTEVSMDNGATWHPATGQENWEFRARVPDSAGSVTIKTRGVDDSGNIGAVSNLTITTTNAACQCDDVKANIKGWWNLNEANGSATFADISGNGNTGTASSVSSYKGIYLNGGDFPGGYSKITAPTQNGLDIGSGDITIGAWIRPYQSDEFIMGMVGNNANYGKYSMFMSNGKPGYGFYGGGLHQNYQCNTGLHVAGDWHHVMFTYTMGQGSSMKCYVDGLLVSGSWITGDGNSLPDPNTGGAAHSFEIGHWAGTTDQNNKNYWFQGLMDEPIVFNKALTASQVAAWYANNCTDSGTSSSVTITPAGVSPGGTITATWAGISTPTSTDWIALYPKGAADGSYTNWRYTTGLASGNVTITVPNGIPSGDYETRLFANNSWTKLATSNTFSVNAAPQATITASPTTIALGAFLNVSWGNIANPTAADWMALYKKGDPDGSYVTWKYTTGQPSGNTTFQIPLGITLGDYELRLFSNNTWTKLGTSNTFTVNSAAPTPTPTPTPSSSPTPAPDPLGITPTNVRIARNECDQGKPWVSLTWDPVSNPNVTGYFVYYDNPDTGNYRPNPYSTPGLQDTDSGNFVLNTLTRTGSNKFYVYANNTNADGWNGFMPNRSNSYYYVSVRSYNNQTKKLSPALDARNQAIGFWTQLCS